MSSDLETENRRLKSQVETFKELLAVTEEVVSIKTEELRKSNQKLHETYDYVAAIIDNMADGLLVIDTKDVITRVNPALNRMLRKEKEDLTGCHIEELGIPVLADLVQQSRAVKMKEAVSIELGMPGNRFAKAEATSIISRDTAKDKISEKSLLGTVVLFTDITREKEVDRVKTEFISTVSHELRTPLTSVLGFAKLIRSALEEIIFPNVKVEDEEIAMEIDDVQDDLGIIVSEGERLTELINDVLDIAKMEAGKVEWKTDPIDVAELIERATAATSSLFTNKAIKLEKSIPEKLPYPLGDMDRLIQVVINLLSNAVKFTDEGVVKCQAHVKDGEAVVSVIDSGIGIAEEDQPKVFEKFKQVGDTLTEKPKGTGLGLPICKEIVKHHGGRIWVENAPDKGCNFSFTLPVKENARISITDQEIEALIGRMGRQLTTCAPDDDKTEKTVLVVDDEENIRKLVIKQLEAKGYRVKQAKDGPEAIEQVREEKPALIVLDIMMPGMNGFEVANVLKNDPDTKDIPIIILSIIADEEKGCRTGIDGFLPKPFEADQLLSEIEMLIAIDTSKKNILVINEDKAVVKKLGDVLKERGYYVSCAYNSDDGAAMAKTDTPDIIIMDARSPDCDALVNQLRFEQSLQETSFVLLGEDSSDAVC